MWCYGVFTPLKQENEGLCSSLMDTKPLPNPLPSSKADLEMERSKLREEWLREEIRAVRTLAFTLIQWGVTVLTAVETSLYYLRRDVTEHLVASHRILPGELIPWPRWLLGTLFLLFLAYIFSNLLNYLNKKLVSYREQLIAGPSYSGIVEVQPAKTKWSLAPHLLFYAFPLIDLALYFGFSVAKSFNIPW